MSFYSSLLVVGGPESGADATPGPSPIFLMAAFIIIVYLMVFRPAQQKQKQVQTMLAELKRGDRVIINPGIFGEIVADEGDTFHVRVDNNTKIRVLKSAISGRQDQPETESK